MDIIGKKLTNFSEKLVAVESNQEDLKCYNKELEILLMINWAQMWVTHLVFEQY